MLIAFVPVVHEGYIKLFKRYPEKLGILGSDIIADFTSLTRDCRAMNPGLAKRAIDGLNIFENVTIISKSELATLHCDHVIMPDDEVSHALCEKYSINNVTFDSIFLRWNRMPTLRENIVSPDRVILRDDFSRTMMNIALEEAEKSSDWWRQIGAVIVRDGQVLIFAHNRHLPSDFHLSINGDPRTNFNAGEGINLSTAIHAEASIIAQSAKLGIPLAGAEAYVTTFPCPNCARLLAEAGIIKVYYSQGYSLLDAEEILKAYNITISLVDLTDAAD